MASNPSPDLLMEMPAIDASKESRFFRILDPRSLIALFLIVAVLIASTVVNQRNINRLNDNAALVTHTHEVLDAIHDLLVNLLNAETGQRGFVITDRQEFLQPYENALTKIDEDLEKLRGKTSDNERQQARLAALKPLIQRTLDLLRQGIELSRRNAPESQFSRLLLSGKQRMDENRKAIAEIRREEERLLVEREQQSNLAYRAATTSGVIATGCGLVAILAFLFLLDRNIATKRRAAKIIQEQRSWLLTTLASIGDAVITTDNHGNVTFLNAVAESLTGWRLDEARNVQLSQVFNIVNEMTRTPVESPVEKVLREGNIVGLANHTILIAKNGVEIPIDDSAAPIRDHDGKITGVVMVFRDVGDRRLFETSLAKSEARYKALIEATAQIVWTTDPTGQVVEDSPTWRELTGQSYEEWRGTGWLNAVHPDDRATAAQDWATAVEKSQMYVTQYRILNTRGEYRDTIAKGVPVKNEKGEIVEWVGMNMDVTEQRRTDEKLRETQARFRLMADSIPQLAWMAGPDGDIYWFNQRWYEYTGLSTEQSMTGHSRTLHDPKVLPLVLEKWKHCLQTGEIFDMVFPLRGRDGQFRLFLTRVMPMRGQDGKILHWFGTNTDVTEIREMGAALKESEQRFRLLAETVPSIIWSADSEGKVTWVNDQWVRYSGSTVETNQREWLARLIHPDDIEKFSNQWQAALQHGSEFSIEVRNRRFDGVYRWFVTRATPVRDAQGNVTAWFGITTDIHDQKELQEALQESDRRKDEFLATLAHELRNPLAPIRNGLQVMRVSADPQVRDGAREMMERQLTQMVRLVDDLLDVSRINQGVIELRRERMEIRRVIESAVETSRPWIDEAQHELQVTLPGRPLYLLGDLTRLSQVVSNLLNNGAKYTPAKGKISLSVTEQNNHVVIRVKDNGLGIPPNMLNAIFGMFTQVDRTIERSKGGLGIGLTLVQRIVQLHGGSIEAHSDGPGRGSEFVVRLPLSNESPLPAPKDGGTDFDSSQKSSRKILIVDDNKDATLSLSMLLKITGHNVMTADDGPSALEAAREFAPEFVLLDIGLPNMSGYEVAKRLRLMPEVQNAVLVAQTGWGQEEDRRRSKEAGFDHHLVKPIEISSLEAILGSDSSRSP